MADYVVIDREQLEADLTSLGDAIREKSGVSGALRFPGGMVEAIAHLEIGGAGDVIPAALVDGTMQDAVIEDGVGRVRDYMFYYYTGLKSITIPDSVTRIGVHAFTGCTALTSVTIGNSVTSIGGLAFYGCTKLTSITIPESVTRIDAGAFNGCTNLTAINVPWSEGEVAGAPWGAENATVIYSYNTTLGAALLDRTGWTAYSPSSPHDNMAAYAVDKILDGDTATGWMTNKLADVAADGITVHELIVTFPDITTVSAIRLLPRQADANGRFQKFDIMASTTADQDDYYVVLSDVTMDPNSTAAETINLGSNIAMRRIKIVVKTGMWTRASLDEFNAYGESAYLTDDHIHSEVHVGAQEPTCTTTGLTGGTYCSVCGLMLEAPTIIPALGHTEVIDAAVAPTCTTTGLTEGKHCSVCGEVLVEQEVVPALGHTVDGNGICTVCGKDVNNALLSFAYVDGGYEELAVSHVDAAAVNVRIPAEYNGKPVVGIKSYAFDDCIVLESVTVPESVTYIEESAFMGCTRLKSVNLPSGITSIGSNTFQDCSALTSVAIPAGVTSIGAAAFMNCSKLTSVTVPDGVTAIARSTFNGCTRLKSVNIPSGVTSIGANAFNNCVSLASLTIPSGVTTIEASTFSGCEGLTGITIPNGVTSIGNFAFHGCRSLTGIDIPKGVTSIGESAFWNCESITGIVIPAGVISIGDSILAGCDSLTSITVEAGNTVYHSEGNCLIETASGAMIGGCKNSVIPDGVTSIGDYVFLTQKALTSIHIPASVTSIGKLTFAGCDGLTSITLPNSLMDIGERAFDGCNGMTSIHIPASVTSIGTDAFQGSYTLKAINISKPYNSISGSPWGASNATVNWDYDVTLGASRLDDTGWALSASSQDDVNTLVGNVLDGDTSTYWMTDTEPECLPPHELIIHFHDLKKISAIGLLPQTTNGDVGRFINFDILTTDTSYPENATPVRENVTCDPTDVTMQIISLGRNVEARVLKIVIHEGQGGPASLAEFCAYGESTYLQ